MPEKLYHTFPNAKFVLTTRDEDEWKKSVRSYFQKFPERKNLILKWEQQNYNQRVKNLIPKDQLLILDSKDDNKMYKLCKFLGVFYKGQKYPRRKPRRGWARLHPQYLLTIARSFLISFLGLPLINFYKEITGEEQ